MNAQTRREILQSDEHWSALSERLGVSRATIYRVRQERDETQKYAERPRGRMRASDITFDQISVSGITRHGGAVTEEFQRELQEDGGARIYTEMSVHPVVAAVLFAIKMGGLRRVRWWTEPVSDKPDDKRVAEFVDECRDDMSQSWSEVMSQIFGMLRYGYQPAELVYKKRLGQEPPKYIEDPARSRYTDNLIGWRRWQFINPLSLASGNAWDFDDFGRVQAINQIPPPDYKPRKIPMEKALLFRTEVEYDSPEGKSVLRPMYRPWYYATNLAEVEAIGAERLGVGLPVMYLGNDCTLSGADSDYDLAKDLVTNIRSDEQMGVVIPRPRLGSAGEGQGMLLELMSPPSRGLINFSEVIERYEQRMAMVVLAQFIFLGMRKVGTQALASTSVDFFVDAVGAWADAVGDVINRFALPRLLALNPFDLEEMPVLKHSEIGVLDLTSIAAYVNALVGAQVLTPFPELQKHLLEIADFPEMPEKPAQLAPPAQPEPPPPQLQPATGPIAPEGPEQPEGVEGEEDAERFGEDQPRDESGRWASGGGGGGAAAGGNRQISRGVGELSMREVYTEWDGSARGVARAVVEAGDEYDRLVLRDGDEAVGVALYTFDQEDGALYVNALASKRSGAGYGTDLMVEMCKEAQRRGIGVRLESYEEAVPFYRKMGMQETPGEDFAVFEFAPGGVDEFLQRIG